MWEYDRTLDTHYLRVQIGNFDQYIVAEIYSYDKDGMKRYQAAVFDINDSLVGQKDSFRSMSDARSFCQRKIQKEIVKMIRELEKLRIKVS